MAAKDGALEIRPASRDVLADMHWQPGRDTLVALGSYALVVAALFVAFQVFTTARVEATYGFVLTIALMVGLVVAARALYRRTVAGEQRSL